MNDREFGELSERVRGIQEDVSGLRGDMHTVKGSIGEIATTLSSIKGGWKVIASIAAIAAAAGGLLAKLTPFLLVK